MSFTIYHNPRCRKSRETLQLLRDKGIEPTVVEYLKEPLSVKELDELCGKLDVSPGDLLRKSEKVFKENYKGNKLSDEQALQAMADHPKLMERPVVVSGEKAEIGRPPENVQRLL